MARNGGDPQCQRFEGVARGGLQPGKGMRGVRGHEVALGAARQLTRQAEPLERLVGMMQARGRCSRHLHRRLHGLLFVLLAMMRRILLLLLLLLRILLLLLLLQ
jgi:hypothetical protein